MPNNIAIVIDDNNNYNISSLKFLPLITIIVSENMMIILKYLPTLEVGDKREQGVYSWLTLKNEFVDFYF